MTGENRGKHCLVGQAILNNIAMFPHATAAKNIEFSAHMFNCNECQEAEGIDIKH